MNEFEYRQAVQLLDELLDDDPPEGSENFNRAAELASRIEQYEKHRWPIPQPTPDQAVIFRLENEPED